MVGDRAGAKVVRLGTIGTHPVFVKCGDCSFGGDTRALLQFRAFFVFRRRVGPFFSPFIERAWFVRLIAISKDEACEGDDGGVVPIVVGVNLVGGMAVVFR